MRTVVLLRTAMATAGALAYCAPSLAQANYFQDFDNVGPTQSPSSGPQNLINQGWIFRNQSSPLGTQSWFQGYTGSGWPSPQAGGGYMAVTSSSTDYFGGTVSNWAILPAVPNQQAGDELRFYLLDTGGSNINTLQVRYSPGGGTSTGSGPSAVGDFTQLLLDISPIPAGGWNHYSVALPGPGRVALRYYIASACNWACFSSYTGIDSLSVGLPPPPPCNLPAVPAAGQTVIWTAAGGPYDVCQNIGIPPDATVIVEPGVQVNFDANMQLVVSGTLRMQGQDDQPILLSAPAVFPPMIEVSAGTLEADFAEFSGQVLIESGANVVVRDCAFSGFGLMRSDEIPAVMPYVHVERCLFDGVGLGLVDAFATVRENTFLDASLSVLRGHADLVAPNRIVNGSLFVSRQESIQPLPIDGANVSGSTIAGLSLNGGTFRIGPSVVLQGNPYPLQLLGGLTGDSVVPASGNTINAIDVGNGGFAGDGRWPNLGLTYRLTVPAGSLPGGNLTIDPGVTVEAAVPGAAMIFASTRHGVLDGLPGAPITFRGLGGQSWDGLMFSTNSTTGCRMEYCVVEDADFGVISSDNGLYVDNCILQNNQVGANTNTFGTIHFSGTRFIANGAGASFTDLGSPVLNRPSNPNSFEGNGVGLDAFEFGASADARNCWWNHPTGPDAPGNPGGQGDPISGVGASGVQYQPFLTSQPDFANHPPVVRLVEPGLTRLYASPDYTHPDFLLDQGTTYILRWDVQSDDAVVTQRIEFSPDGHYPSRYTVLVDDIPGDARSWEITVPDPGFAVTNQPQFLRVVAVDAAGKEGTDQVPVQVPSGNITGNLTITTDLSGQTFYAGQEIPDVHWTGSVSGFGSVKPLVVLESDGAAILGLNIGGQGDFFLDFPMVSTDRARLALEVRNNSNDVAWFFADGYFSIRHDPRLGFAPPTVQLTSPQGGEIHGGGTTVPIRWTAQAAEGLRSFDIQASYDAGRTWHPIARDLPAQATSFDWRLPPSDGIADVRVRVIVRDERFQNSSATSGGFAITPGDAPPGDLDGDGDVDLADLSQLLSAFGTCDGDNAFDPAADLDGDGCVGLADLSALLTNYGASA
ncbi:MAG: hypothetical protein HRF50_00635 [Phycisphaerae bacterium]